MQLLRAAGSTQYAVVTSSDTLPVVALGTPGSNLTVFLANFDVFPKLLLSARVTVTVQGAKAPPSGMARVFRIDESHANAKAAWRRDGSPAYLTPKLVSAYMLASALALESIPVQSSGTSVSFEVELEPHSVLAAVLDV